MPELPEVETIKRVIEPQIQGLTIENVTVKRPEVTAYPTADEFCKLLTGQTVSHMIRRGKFLVIQLNSNDRIILHLRMTGCLLLTPADYPEEKHTHVIFRLNNGKELRFSDTRRFGRLWLLKNGKADTYSGIEKLGTEPLDKLLTAEYLKTLLGKRKKTVKECLLDQSVIAGIGNIYSDEILFTAGIYPARPANSLNMEEWERLAAVIPERISYFIEVNKITPEEYLETKGQDYRNTPFLQVYGREGKPCPKCGEMLCRMVVGGRGSDRTMTFGELFNLADLIAGSFPERITSVGIVMSHRAEMIAAILAVLKCGARYVPAEPNFPPMCFTLPARQDDQREFVLQTVMSAIM